MVIHYQELILHTFDYFELLVLHNVLIACKHTMRNVHWMSLLVEAIAVCTCLLELFLFGKKFQVIQHYCDLLCPLHLHSCEGRSKATHPRCGLPLLPWQLSLLLQSGCSPLWMCSFWITRCDMTATPLCTSLWEICYYMCSRWCMSLHTRPLQHQLSDDEEDIVQLPMGDHCIWVWPWHVPPTQSLSQTAK